MFAGCFLSTEAWNFLRHALPAGGWPPGKQTLRVGPLQRFRGVQVPFVLVTSLNFHLDLSGNKPNEIKMLVCTADRGQVDTAILENTGKRLRLFKWALAYRS